MAYSPVGAKTYTLGASIGSTDTTIRLTSFTEPVSGTPYTMVNINSDIVYATIAPKTTSSEFISFTGITQNVDGSATLTGVIRGLQKKYPFASSSTFKLPHSGQTQFILSNSPEQIEEYAKLRNAQTFTALQTFTLLPESNGGNATDPTQLITYAQALALATGTASINRIVVAGTAGENVSAGNTLYLDSSDNTWKKTDADVPATVNNIIKGIAQGTGTTGNPITNGVLLYGIDSNQSGLIAGGIYYFGNTPGQLSATPGTTEVTAGQAISATQILFYAQFNQQLTEDQQDALAGASGGPSSTNLYETQNDTSNGSTKTDITIAFVNSNPDTITDSGNGFVTAGFLQGQSIIITGSASNNGTFTIASVAAGTLTLIATDSLVAEGAGATVTIATAINNKLIRATSAGQVPPTIKVDATNGLTGIVPVDKGGSGLTNGAASFSQGATVAWSGTSVPNNTVTKIAEFTGLTGDTDDIYDMEFEINANTSPGTGANLYLRLNDDSANHYGYSNIFASDAGGTPGSVAAGGGGAGQITIAHATAAISLQNSFGWIKIKASKTIAGTTRYTISDTCSNANGASNLGNERGAGGWNDVSAQITSVQLYFLQNSGGTITSSGTATLYKIKR